MSFDQGAITTGEDQVQVPPEGSADWRRVHPATPAINAWKVLSVLLAVLVVNSLDSLIELFQALDSFPILAVVLAIAGAVLLVIGVALLYSWLAWRRMRYAVGQDAVYFHHGVIFRQQRHARLNRIQGVDILRPLLGRMVGLSAVNIESAGGAGSGVRIQFLRDEEAERLRAEVLARAAGLTAPTAAPGQAPVFAQAPEREVYRLSLGDQVLSLLLSGELAGAVLVLAGLTAAAVLGDMTGLALAGLLPVALAAGGMLFSRFTAEFNHTLAVSPDGLRIRAGLLSTRALTLPPGRVQAISVSQGLLWRWRGWWRVEVNVAGYGAPDNSNGQNRRTPLLPLAERSQVLDALWLVLQDLGVDDTDAVIDAALTGTLSDGGFLHSPASARWVDPIRWKRNGLLITRTALLMRDGVLRRRVVVVPHERTQSLRLQQGPWERRLGLADFVADSVPGPVAPRASHLPAEVAGRLILEQAERARRARALEGPEEWMRRVAAAPGPEPDPGADAPDRMEGAE